MILKETRIPKYVDLKDKPTGSISNVIIHIDENENVSITHYDINDKYLDVSLVNASQLVARWQGTPLTTILKNRKADGYSTSGSYQSFVDNDEQMDLKKWKST
jgi:hypothetical protein